MPKYGNKHKQEWVTLANGKKELVDKGLVHFLTLMAELGIQTEYSCQGSKTYSAYVVMTFKSFWPVFKLIVKSYFLRRYSKPIRNLIKEFKRGRKEIIWSGFTKSPTGLYAHGHLEFSRGNWYKIVHSFEISYSRENKLRVTLRWPKEETYMLCTLLFDTQDLKEQSQK